NGTWQAGYRGSNFSNEKTRIINVRDVVEPRVKVSGPGCVFPGILGPVETVGEGRTHRLSGVTVMASVDYQTVAPAGAEKQRSGLVDMWGAGSQMTPFGSTINIVLIFKLVGGVSGLEAHAAIQLAEFRVAHRLAEATRNELSDNMEIYDLFKVDVSLPRVVYIMGCKTGAAFPNFGNAYYGLPIRETLPLFIHPNELLDGALTPDARQGSSVQPTSWEYMNQPAVLGLFKRHGKELNFLGVIFQRTRFETEHGKQVTAAATSQMARLMGADGAIITRVSSSGNNFVDVMLTVQACERKGVKVVLLGPEWGGRDGTEAPLLSYVPEATAMVTTGGLEREIILSTPTKVVGGGNGHFSETRTGETFSPWSEGIAPPFSIIGSTDWWGATHRTCKEY
ncbi:glycine/sarcosine/betaine reductase component B subunit, partial [Thermodesulfobacteriota bacterium]